jgi:hypothetical protein
MVLRQSQLPHMLCITGPDQQPTINQKHYSPNKKPNCVCFVAQGEAADQDALTSAGLLNLLTAKQRALAGDRPGQVLLGRLLEAAAEPYFGILEKWLCRGELDDPYHEFMVKVGVNFGVKCSAKIPSGDVVR